MSSKLEISVKTPSGPDSCDDDRYDEDLEDLEPDSSGGELGVVVVQIVVISRLSVGKESYVWHTRTIFCFFFSSSLSFVYKGPFNGGLEERKETRERRDSEVWRI